MSRSRRDTSRIEHDISPTPLHRFRVPHLSLDNVETIKMRDLEALKKETKLKGREEKAVLRLRRYYTIFRWWRGECIYIFICLLATGLLVLVLSTYNNRPVPAPHWIGSLQLDTFIIAMITIIRVSMGAIVESSLSQAAWIWVSQARQQSCRHKARLGDFKIFDEASRGLLGSLNLLWHLKIRYDACHVAGSHH